jgi:hypothetical protein
MITISQKGDFSNLSSFLERAKAALRISCLDKYGRLGVDALSAATPVDTGKTADSWSYEIVRSDDNESVSLVFNNSNMTSIGTPVAILLQYGHGTGGGGYVKGIDYINPALKPIFQQIADEAWREVSQ